MDCEAILAVGLLRPFEPLMGKFFVLTLDLRITRLLCALFALRNPCSVIIGPW
jgi:hypothetical protein